MEQKIKALKISGKIISVITKIGYITMVIMVGICASMLLFLVMTGGNISDFTVGKTTVVFFDKLTSTPAELTAICSVLTVVGGIFFAVFLLAYRMFHEISRTGEPFTEKFVKTVRAIGILIAAMPFAAGFTEFAASLFTKTDMPEILSDIPGVVIGAIIFCLSFIIDYGCAIRKKLDAASEERPKI